MAFMKIAKASLDQDSNQIDKNSDSDQEDEEQLMFPIQEQLKEKDQNEFEKTLIQQDIDLIINFKECIQQIYENIQQIDRNTRSALMKATDSICARIQTFPVQTIQKVEDIDEFVPKLIIYNKQLYEILFTLLQTHPCYLINWLMGSMKKEICLWDFHPLAFAIEDDENFKSMWTQREKYQSFSEQLIQHDDECSLILIIYGGMKCIFNNKRIINNIMMIGIQIFELELKESLDSKTKYHSNFYEIITGKQKKDTGFTKLQRLVFQSSSQNQQFTEELLYSIIFLLQKMKFEDGNFRQKPEEGQAEIQYKMDVFDYDGVISDVDKSSKRSQNLRNFLEKLIYEVLIKNIELEQRLAGKNDCQNIFSNETLLMNINAYQSLIEKSYKIIDKKYSSKNLTDEEKENKEQEKLNYEDYARQFCLKNIFEDLCKRLQNVKVCDIHQAFNNKIENNDWKSLSNYVFPFGVRNNYYFIGRALMQIFSGEKILYTTDSVIHIKQFMDKHGRDFRQKIWESIQSLKTKDDINNINQVLVKLTIEEAMEPFNDICTVQLRDIVYLHNQIISYGEKIYIKGFEQVQDTKKEDQNANNNEDDQIENEEDENQQSIQISEMDPLKIIFEQLGNQYIILKTQSQEYISQKTLNRSISLKIQTRIFENFSEIIRCSDCNGIVYEGLIPRQRFFEGLNMKAWNCANSNCKFRNTNEMSLQCKQCQSPRPPETLPKDMMFQLYTPLNPNEPVNQQILKFEKMLQVCQVFQEDQNLEEELAKIKKEEKKKEKGIDYDKLSIIEDFLEMRENHIKKEMKKINNTAQKRLGPLVPKEEEKKIEDQLYEKLLQRIKDNMEKRTNHQDILDKNNEFIIFLRDKAQQVASRNKIQLDLINLIQKNAKSGAGNEFFLKETFNEYGLYTGRLDKLNNQDKNNDGKKKEEKKKDELKDGDLGKYFAEIERKQKLQPAQPKLQKKLEENRERRNMMKSQFGQFASFPALELQKDGVINSVKINGKNIDNIIKQCKYLFYEIKEDLQMLKEGGYRVELSFDETGSGICGSASADSRQTILSTFVIDNPMIIEMRRLMATKTSINLVGTEFNIFKLIQKINSIKTKSQQYVN